MGKSLRVIVEAGSAQFLDSIRFAAPPTGSNRWQPPKAPAVNRSAVINANHYGSQCPQTSLSGPNRPSILASEDCLFLNVYSPAGAKDLPVLIYIHGMIEVPNANDFLVLIMPRRRLWLGQCFQHRSFRHDCDKP